MNARSPSRSHLQAIRAVIVHDVDQARLAVAVAAETGVPVALWSPPGAAAYMGAGYFYALAEAARASAPEARIVAVLDCAEEAGRALAGLRQGLDGICFRGLAEVADKLESIAQQQGALFYRGIPAALDLGFETDPEAACREWLGGNITLQQDHPSSFETHPPDAPQDEGSE